MRTFAGGGDPGQAAAWSPDGRELAFGFLRDTTEGARAKLRIVDLRGHSRELAERIDGRPAWSPGGRWLAFTTGEVLESVGPGNPPSRADLVVVRVRGKGGRARRLAGSDPDAHFDPSWSPDGRVILFSHADRGESWSIRAMVPTTGAQRTLVGRLIDAQPDWSPNGRQIAITATTLGGDGTAHLYVLARRGGRLRRLVRNVTGAPAWSPDGTLVAFPDGDRVRVIRADGKAGRTVARLRGADISDVDWSPDGKRLTFVAGRRPVES